MKFDFLTTYWPFYIEGLKITIIYSVFAVIFGIILGVALALMKISKLKLFKAFAVSYINFVRGTPILVQIYIVYFGLFSFGINLADSTAGVAALAINSGAYVAEIVRAGIEAVDKGQIEAARSLGMSHFATTRLLVIPQAIKNILPALCNEFIVTTKNTSMLSIIGIHDLMYNTDTIRGNTLLAFEPLIIAAVIYFTISYVLSKLIGMLERRLRASDDRS
ncbi:His/Glu/Gln/Arg/opine family amino ABC transporter, permease, 3-TM region [Lachnospiraceae bacterium MD308]|jgi:His/Glu/Gln/Arg/opine family amino acid ABC transporter permease subunit|nr:His/Glu/Gln/Arg/opine family amino ABC transporter, permease, 3-TM region [Lachnospiraceae bacterium MD308]MCI8502347.1 amino acid ABC transporter permease [Dorea sp.]